MLNSSGSVASKPSKATSPGAKVVWAIPVFVKQRNAIKIITIPLKEVKIFMLNVSF